ncbi:hypothetical protein ACJIZ3_012635 [Penstemon smallii]|uniref:Interactor of constitutive active ROPs 3 n=1 Tax=Penstemon smallii TaxID=265156 RepID=A0ABD3UQV9_9LAMI
MQTPKARTSSSSQRKSPQSISSEVSNKNSPQASQNSPRGVVRQLKTGARYSEPTASSSNQAATKSPKERSPKIAERKSPRSSISEKKQPSRVGELESQISQLENDLKIVKDQLCSSETSKKQAQKDLEESNQQILALSSKLEESKKQLPSENVHTEQDQISLDSAAALALASALDEIKQLKVELETVANSESTQSEVHKLKENLAESHSLVEDMKNQLKESKESEANAKAIVNETLIQLETAKKTMETLKSDGCKVTETYDAIASDLDQSRARVNFLEELVSKLKSDSQNEKKLTEDDYSIEVEQLRSALEAAEIRYHEEQARSTEQTRNAYEMVEKIKSLSGQREAELEAELRKSKYLIEELKANMMDKENELQGICEENEQLTVQLENTLSGQREQELENELENLKANLINKEIEWHNLFEANEKLKVEINNLEAAKAAEREALMKVGYMTEEFDKSNRKAARVAEQLEAAQATNAEMEAELRRLKVQSDQWRKAAEAAAAMLSTGNNNGGQLVERTGSMDSNYNPRTGRISSPYGDELDEDLLKKKNANMLRKIGVLWKKPQK